MLSLLLLTLHKDQRRQRLSHFNQLQHVLQREGLNGPWALVYDTLPGARLDTTKPAPLHDHGWARPWPDCRAEQSSLPFQKFLQSSDASGSNQRRTCIISSGYAGQSQVPRASSGEDAAPLLPPPSLALGGFAGQGDLQPHAEMATRLLQVPYPGMLVNYNFQAAPGTALHYQGTSAVPLCI